MTATTLVDDDVIDVAGIFCDGMFGLMTESADRVQWTPFQGQDVGMLYDPIRIEQAPQLQG